MRVIFLGVGEAFDPEACNNAHLVHSQAKLLLDCGYATPGQLWSYNRDPEFLDAVFISHMHADHYFGLPVLFLIFWELKRVKPLTILTPEGAREQIISVTQLAYPRLYEKLPFPVEYLEASESDTATVGDLRLTFAESVHPVTNWAVRVDAGSRSVCYSGDGMFTGATVKLFSGASLLIHETYVMESGCPGHSGVQEVIDMARKASVRSLALTHLKRDLRRQKSRVLEYIRPFEDIRILLPEPMDQHDVV
jgi:ribonuclease BN (tRNA processing enzyme)